MSARTGSFPWLPWFVTALATLLVAMVHPSPVPAGVVLAVLAWAVLGRRPRVAWKSTPWLLLVPFAFWWVRLSLVGDPRPDELLGIVSWYLLLLSSVQILAGGGTGGWKTWNAMSAAFLSGFRPDAIQIGVVILIVGLVLVQTRLEASERGATGYRPLWGVAMLPVVLLAFSAQWLRVSIPVRGFDRWRPPMNAKGFSSTLRLGGGFGQLPDPSDDVVVLRAWSERPPRFMKGAVFDLYSRGQWIRSEGWTNPASTRSDLDFFVFCQVSDTLARASGWASATDATEGHLLVPPTSGCVGVATDTIQMITSGAWRLAEEKISRGWSWFPGEVSRRTRESERTLPRGFEGALDSACEQAQVVGSPPEEAIRRIDSWLSSAFRYSLQPRERPGEDPLRTFLREREGYCEHFATLGALLARKAGIPSRVVTGYAHPERVAGAWIFRRSHAHAWVELNFPGRGWVTWDPTPPSAGERTTRGPWRRWSDVVGTIATSWWHAVRDGAWRIALGDRLERASVTLEDAWVPKVLALVAALFLGAIAWRRRAAAGRGDAGRWRRGLARAEARLRREGLVRERGETVGAFLQRLPASSHAPSREFLEDYQRSRWSIEERNPEEDRAGVR